MSDIFINYSREDKSRVQLLAEALQNTSDWSVWWNAEISAINKCDEVIEAALDKPRCVVVIWSETSVKSRWIKGVAEESQSRGVLVQLLFDDVNVPPEFEQLLSINFTTWKGDTNSGIFHKLLTDVSVILGETEQKIPEVHPEESVLSKPDNTKKNIEIGIPRPRSKVPKPKGTNKTLENKSQSSIAKLSQTHDTEKKLEIEQPSIKTRVAKSTQNQSLKISFLEPELLQISGGKFLMGSPKTENGRSGNEHLHEVTVADFAIGKFLVTFAEYDMFCEATGRNKSSIYGWGLAARPVTNICWQDANDYTEWLSEVTGKSYLLLTEAEWEYAARGGTQTAYWWGENFEEGRTNCAGSHGKTTRVDSFQPNPFGLYDMLGNVWEWTASLYKNDYQDLEIKYAEKGDDNRRVVHGGSWQDLPEYTRSAARGGYSPSGRGNFLGFRLALKVFS